MRICLSFVTRLRLNDVLRRNLKTESGLFEYKARKLVQERARKECANPRAPKIPSIFLIELTLPSPTPLPTNYPPTPTSLT